MTGFLDETMAVKDHDVVLVPCGHHPCGAPYGVRPVLHQCNGRSFAEMAFHCSSRGEMDHGSGWNMTVALILEFHFHEAGACFDRFPNADPWRAAQPLMVIEIALQLLVIEILGLAGERLSVSRSSKILGQTSPPQSVRSLQRRRKLLQQSRRQDCRGPSGCNRRSSQSAAGGSSACMIVDPAAAI